MFHNSGRWTLGSHWPNSSRKLNTRSLARAFSSSRRATPTAAANLFSRIARRRGAAQADGGVELVLADRAQQRHGLNRVARRDGFDDAARVDVLLHAGDDEP